MTKRPEFEIEASAPEATDKGERCTVRARVPEDLRYLEGHFENDPIVPGIAQLLPLVFDQAKAAWPDLGAPSAIKRLKFLDALRPGHELDIELLREGDRLRFAIKRGETLCTSGSLVFE